MVAVNDALLFRQHGTALLRRGLLVAAREQFERWLALVEPTADPAQMIPPLNGLAKIAESRGDLEGAVQYLERALALSADPVAPPKERLRVCLNLMMVHTSMGRLDAALEFANRAADLNAGKDPGVGLAYWLNLSLLYWRRHEWQGMHDAADIACQRGAELDNPTALARALINRGIARLELGRDRDAEADYRAALALAPTVSLWDLAYAHTELGRLHFQRDDYTAALGSAREALNALVTRVTAVDKEEVARVSRLFGGIFAKSGQRNLALKYLNRAAAYFSQIGLRAEWMRSTEEVGRVLSEAVRPARPQLMQEMQKLDLMTAVLDLTDDLESVDSYLRGHCERVAGLAVMLGELLGLTGDDLVTLNMAAHLHDAGMIAVDTELLQKSGPLTEGERQRVAMHSVIGEEMMRPYGLSRPGLLAIRHHHEHWDGSGWPDGLRQDEIPLMARIITVADAYDAMTSERAYRPAMSHGAAMAELQKMAGRDLDPQVTDVFLSLHSV